VRFAATLIMAALPAVAFGASPAPVLVAQVIQPPAGAPAAMPPTAEQPSAVPAPSAAPAVPGAARRIEERDLTALRYYVEIKDWNRVESEIRRLRAIDPSWQPPADLMGGQAGPSVNEQELWDLFGTGRYAEVRTRIAQLQQADPTYTPSADLLRQLDIAEGQQRLGTASETAQWQAVIDQARRQPDLLNCARTDTVWRTAEAFARLQQTASAFDLYRSVIGTCSNLQERVATLQKANAFLSAEQMAQLYALAKQRSGADAGAIDEVQTSLEAGRRGAQRSPATQRASGPSRAAATQTAAADAAKQSGAYADCLRLTDGSAATGMKLTRAWCLYELARPTEASSLFAAVRSQGRATAEVQDATYGLILATLRRGLIDDAQALIENATLTGQQHREVQGEVLAQLGTAAHQRGDYREALRLFDARDELGAPPRRDLQLLRGFAFYNLRRYREALDVFLAIDRVLSTPDSREGVRIARGGLYGFN
jgi:tetratricopeptide (TPR) repeat protein